MPVEVMDHLLLKAELGSSCWRVIVLIYLLTTQKRNCLCCSQH